ncbi:hypothetical protein [Paenisporosarcina sp. TG20]|uniref:hypothetical protein n=1 Tax=Paenisporosarcina sp. TG20 TaxID=1211706 RepID=UPI00037106E0|nr:hypothetical protein [Paenisporosarcina sp. TG20]
MNFKLLILLICSYLIAFSINLMPSIKHLDLHMNIFNLLATTLFSLILLLFITKGLKANKKIKTLLLFGVFTGVLVYVIKMFEDFMFKYIILDILASIQYPFYLIFMIPLFRANFLFDLSYPTFALLMSIFYLLALILVSCKKTNYKRNQLGNGFDLRSTKQV